MARKSQFTAEDVILGAIDSVREKGWEGLSGPAVAQRMGCSTMPIYSYFENMQALEDEVVKRAWNMVMEYQAKRYTDDVWINQAIGWIKFAWEENNLFVCMLNSRNQKLQYQLRNIHWQYLSGQLADYETFNGLDSFQIETIRYSHAMLTQGIAVSDNLGFTILFKESDEMLYGYLARATKALGPIAHAPISPSSTAEGHQMICT